MAIKLTITETLILDTIKARYKETGVAVSPFCLAPPDLDIDPAEAGTACKRLVDIGLLKVEDENMLPNSSPLWNKTLTKWK